MTKLHHRCAKHDLQTLSSGCQTCTQQQASHAEVGTEQGQCWAILLALARHRLCQQLCRVLLYHVNCQLSIFMKIGTHTLGEGCRPAAAAAFRGLRSVPGEARERVATQLTASSMRKC